MTLIIQVLKVCKTVHVTFIGSHMADTISPQTVLQDKMTAYLHSYSTLCRKLWMKLNRKPKKVC